MADGTKLRPVGKLHTRKVIDTFARNRSRPHNRYFSPPGFMTESNLEAPRDCPVVKIERKSVDRKLYIASRGDVAVEIYIRSPERHSVFSRIAALRRRNTPLRLYGATPAADSALQMSDTREIGRATRSDIDSHPYSAHVSYRSAGSPDLKITFGKMAVKPFYPRGETVILMNARQTVYLYC